MWQLHCAAIFGAARAAFLSRTRSCALRPTTNLLADVVVPCTETNGAHSYDEAAPTLVVEVFFPTAAAYDRIATFAAFLPQTAQPAHE